MGKHQELIDRLRKHEGDYHTGKTQDFCAVCNDCGTAAMEIIELEQERNTLKARLEHLLLSETISQYDAKNHCGGYIYDICGLDQRIEARAELETTLREVRAERDELINENAMLRKQLELCCDVVEPPECATDRAAPAVQYICDRRACEVCNFECKYTEDIRHAKHFELFGRDMYEQEG